MLKTIACPSCGGYGFHRRHNENSVWSERCEECNGSGKVEVPMTNADRIRAMSDEELADYLAELGSMANNGVIWSDRPEEWLEWLQQPAEGE